MVLAGAGLPRSKRSKAGFATGPSLDDKSQQTNHIPLIWTKIRGGLNERANTEGAWLPIGMEGDDTPRHSYQSQLPVPYPRPAGKYGVKTLTVIVATHRLISSFSREEIGLQSIRLVGRRMNQVNPEFSAERQKCLPIRQAPST